MIAPAVREFLNGQGAAFTESWHPRAATALAEANKDHTQAAALIKTVLVHAQDQYVLAAMSADCRIDWPKLARFVGTAELRLATEAELDRLFPSLEVGAIPPLGPMFGLPVFLDGRLLAHEQVSFNAGSHNNTIHMTNRQFQQLVRPVIGNFAVKLQPPGRGSHEDPAIQ